MPEADQENKYVPPEDKFIPLWRQLPESTVAERKVKKLSIEDQRVLLCTGGMYTSTTDSPDGEFLSNLPPARVRELATKVAEMIEAGELKPPKELNYENIKVR